MINLREWALPVYTIMMQMAAGSMLMLWLVYTVTLRRYGLVAADRITHNPLTIIFFTVLAAMVGSHYHLSRPYFSFLAVRNFESSWLSREVTFTIAFAGLAGSLWILQRYTLGTRRLRLAIGSATVTMGITTVYSMSHVYLLPIQIAWNSLATPIAFFSATFLLGGMGVSAMLLMNLYLAILRDETTQELDKHTSIIRITLEAAVWIAIAAATIEIVTYFFQIDRLSNGGTSARASLDLLLGLYRVLFGIRLGLLTTGVCTLALSVVWQRRAGKPLVRLLTPVYITFLLVLVGEVLGRFLFYAIHVRTGI